MTKNKKMINFFIALGVIGAILVATSVAGYRIYSRKANTEREKKATEQRKEIRNNVNTTKLELSKQIKQSGKELDKGQQKILDKLDKIDNHSTDPNGLYKNKTKWGTVIGFKLSPNKKTFTIEQINFDQPIRDTKEVWTPFVYKNYKIRFTNIGFLVKMLPPGAKRIKGVILKNDIN